MNQVLTQVDGRPLDEPIVLQRDDIFKLLPHMLDVAWAWNYIDISSTLSGACWRLFQDASTKKEQRRRAQAIAVIAEEFLALVDPVASFRRQQDSHDMEVRLEVAMQAARSQVSKLQQNCYAVLIFILLQPA